MKFGRLKGHNILIKTQALRVALIQANSFIKASKLVFLLFLVIFVFLNKFQFKSQTKVISILERLLETIFLIFAIISIQLFLAKITILPPNYMTSMNQSFWAFSSHLRFFFYYLNLLQPPGQFNFHINKNSNVIYCFLQWIQGLSPFGFKESLVDLRFTSKN